MIISPKSPFASSPQPHFSSEGNVASTSFSLDVSNTLTNYARSNTLAIPEDSLKLILKEKLETYDARKWVITFSSVAFSLTLGGFSTLGVKVNFWRQDFTVSTLFFVFALVAIVFTVCKIFVCWRQLFSYHFVDEVFKTIQEKLSDKNKEENIGNGGRGSLGLLNTRRQR